MRDLDQAMLNGLVKGLPPHWHGAREEIGRQGWNLLAGDLPLPAGVLRKSALANNSRWMQRFVQRSGALLAPHVKTTMCPSIIRQQIEDGAWGVTVATIQQMRVCRDIGVQRIVLANQPIGAVERAYVVAELQRDPEFDFYCLVDSVDGASLLAAAAQQAGLRRPIQLLLELGYPNGRTGVRGVEAALAVARAIRAQAPSLALAGVEGFEGLLLEADVDPFLDEMASLFQACRADGLFGVDAPMLSAGGSTYYDRVLDRFADTGARVVTRSGCYVTHDSGIYARTHAALQAKLGGTDGLQRALEVWAYVQSRPEPGLALLTAGRRDFGTDAGFPVPLLQSRDGAAPHSIEGQGWEISASNDQHAYLKLPPDADLRVGDRIGLGVSHPCTTLDKWQLLLVVDDSYRVVDAYRTFF